MKSEIKPADFVVVARNWPEQIVVDHAPYWRAWRRSCNGSPEVEQRYEIIGRIWFAFANGKNIGPQLMVDWMIKVNSMAGLKGQGVMVAGARSRYRYMVKNYIKWLYVMGAIERDPTDCLPKLPNAAPAPKQIYTHDEYLKMVEYGRTHAEFDLHLWLVMLGYQTGMSLIDCCTLRWDHVHLPDDGPCFIRRMRSKLALRFGRKSMSTIPIITGSELWVWFKARQRNHNLELDKKDDDFVCDEAANLKLNNPQDPSAYMVAFISAALGSDRKGRSFRHLRNTFCSRLINSGADCVLTAKMTGHSNPAQLADYVVPDQSVMQNVIVKALRYVEGSAITPEQPEQPERQTSDGSCS